MKYNPDKHHRRSIRLPGYDYTSPGGYFITICTHNRQNLFGEIVDGEMILNEYGEIVRDEWVKSSIIRSEIELDQFIIMPNHIHGIVFIFNENCINKNHHGNSNIVGADGRPPLQRCPRSVGSLIAGFKSAVTKKINQIRNTPGNPVWQRNYYEHIIRNDDELNRIRKYIVNNPLKWESDENNPIIVRARCNVTQTEKPNEKTHEKIHHRIRP